LSLNGVSWLFFVEEMQVGDVVLAFQQTVQESNEHRLRHLLSEDALEANVGERVDEFSHDKLNCSAKIRIIFVVAKLFL
jgi:hypothetical protein